MARVRRKKVEGGEEEGGVKSSKIGAKLSKVAIDELATLYSDK